VEVARQTPTRAAAGLVGELQAESEEKRAHSIEFSGSVCHCSSKASRREDLVAWGRARCSHEPVSPPPLETVHATFTAHGSPGIGNFRSQRYHWVCQVPRVRCHLHRLTGQWMALKFIRACLKSGRCDKVLPSWSVMRRVRHGEALSNRSHRSGMGDTCTVHPAGIVNLSASLYSLRTMWHTPPSTMVPRERNALSSYR
jgi:hypothetical protein